MKIIHEAAKKWVDEMAAMCRPDSIVWIDGSKEEKKRLEDEAESNGEVIRLDQEKWPGCLYHRTALNDVARTEGLTFICTSKEEDAGPINNWMPPEEGYRKAAEIFKGSMEGRTMYVIPFSMGPVGSPFSKIGIEITDSIYVVLNMRIMCHIGEPVMKEMGTDGDFTKCLHGKAELDIDKRLILHFPEDNAIWSVGSGYGGNVLLGKKCLALRIASYLAKEEGWMAEHMLILGVEDPSGRLSYVTGAFPSACGKTNLAMLVPPKGLEEKGYKIWTIGDDIAWMRPGEDGKLAGVNPEAGFFGVVPGTNEKTNPIALKTVRSNTIFTNVLLGEDKTIWWEECGWDPPQPATDWQGNDWTPDSKDADGKPVKGAHPNSRFTAPLMQCPSGPECKEESEGVEISAMMFGGRRARLAPLVYEAFDWNHGVFIGSIMASERTAAQYGKIGEVRRDPMAMRPFTGYNMADYFAHWLKMGTAIKNPPKIFHVNWFRTDENGKYLWPGFGDNLRVIEWILARCRGEIDAVETPIGFVPRAEDIDLSGIDVPAANMEKLLEVNNADWIEETNGIEEFYAQFGDRLPKEINKQLQALRDRLK